MVQLPAEARGTAAAVLAFSLISEVAGLLLIWLVWTHRERTSCEFVPCTPTCPPQPLALYTHPHTSPYIYLTNNHTKDVALIAYFTWIATTASVIQQIHLYA